MGLAVGFILGGAISQVVSSVVTDIVNPLIAPILGTTKDLEGFILNIGPFAFKLGHFISVTINFLVIALTVYVGVKILRLDKLDKKEKEEETG